MLINYIKIDSIVEVIVKDFHPFYSYKYFPKRIVPKKFFWQKDKIYEESYGFNSIEEIKEKNLDKKIVIEDKKCITIYHTPSVEIHYLLNNKIQYQVIKFDSFKEAVKYSESLPISNMIKIYHK